MWRPYTPPVPTHADVDAGRGHVGAIVEVIFDGAPRVELLRRRHRRRHRLPQQRRQPPRFRERQSRSAPPSRALRRAAELVDGGCPPSQGALWGRPCTAGGGGGGGLCAAAGPAGTDPPGFPGCPCRVGRVCSGGEAGLRRAAAAGGGANGCGLAAAAGSRWVWGSAGSGESPREGWETRGL